MYIEFKGSSYHVHLWNRKGAIVRLQGDEILEYVCCMELRSQVEWNQSESAFRFVYWNSNYLEYCDVTHLVSLLSNDMLRYELSLEKSKRTET